MMQRSTVVKELLCKQLFLGMCSIEQKQNAVPLSDGKSHGGVL